MRFSPKKNVRLTARWEIWWDVAVSEIRKTSSQQSRTLSCHILPFKQSWKKWDLHKFQLQCPVFVFPLSCYIYQTPYIARVYREVNIYILYLYSLLDVPFLCIWPCFDKTIKSPNCPPMPGFTELRSNVSTDRVPLSISSISRNLLSLFPFLSCWTLVVTWQYGRGRGGGLTHTAKRKKTSASNNNS